MRASDGGIRQALRRMGEGVDPEPDIAEVRARAARLPKTRRRSSAVVVGILAGALAVALVASQALQFGRSAPTSGQPGSDEGEVRLGSGTISLPAQQRVPEGRMLLQIGSHGEILAAGSGASVSVGPYWVHDLSPDGAAALATTVEVTGSGLTRQTKLVSIDTRTGEITVLVRVAANESLVAPIAWSPLTDRIGYRIAEWASDPSQSFPGDPISERVCLLSVPGTTPECVHGLGKVSSFDWAPDGQTLVTSEYPSGPIRLIELATGSSSVLLPPGGNASLTKALADRGLRGTILVSEPVWSASGNYIAVQATVIPGGSLAVVIDRAGEVAAVGRLNPAGPVRMAWSPVTDVLAYALGATALDPTGTHHQVRVADIFRGTDVLVADLEGRANPYIHGLTWSPSGRWLAVESSTLIRLLDANEGGVSSEIRIDADEVADPLVDWAP